MAEFPDFDAFYRAANGRVPFPWQRRLAAQVRQTGWPEAIGVGTGLGKTSCLDVAVWTMAAEHGLGANERKTPTRVWYVVNRRLLVDAAFEHGKHLAALLADPTTTGDAEAAAVLKAVAAALGARQGGAGAEPLHVSRLRGGAELGARPPDPAQPALVFATVPMFASRWLFRGFGTSTAMRPVDAALAGIDSLVLLDEAHLARPLAELAGPLADCDVGDPRRVLSGPRARPAFVRLSATGEGSAFTLDADDHAQPVVAKRLDAAKPLELVEVPKAELVEALADHAERLLAGRPPAAAVVFCNSPATARAVLEELGRRGSRRREPFEADLLLLTGRMREREAAAARERVLDAAHGAPAGRPRPSGREQHLVVVATQTLEVGADLDFDVLVTEACGARALVQRLGRLNRLGDIDDAAAVAVFPRGLERFGIYGEEPLRVWERLQVRATDGVVEVSPRVVTEVVGPPADDPERVGELLPAHLWEWAKTTVAPPGEAPPALFYEGLAGADATVSVIWRAVVPDDGAELHPGAFADEAVDITIWEAREALGQLTDGFVARLRPDRTTVERTVSLSRVRPGDVVILPPVLGGYDAHGWAPSSRETVLDVSLLRLPGIPLDPFALDQLFAPGEPLAQAHALAKVLVAPADPDEDLDRAAMSSQLVEHLRAAGPSAQLSQGEWEVLQGRLTTRITYLSGEVGRLVLAATRCQGMEPELRADVFDELSFVATSADLAEHLGSVGELAGRIGRAVGLDDALVAAVIAAGRFHDLGKADHRFQRWLDPTGAGSHPVAKSSSPPERWRRDQLASGWPVGGRHEELSRRLVLAYLEGHPEPTWDPELVLHLVVSHHGHGRPLVAGVDDAYPAFVAHEVDGEAVSSSGDLSVVDWDQPARFRRCCERYGYWGLALLEAIVRQADHQVSKVVVA
jgi:CRISPR-associated endonuclease/helicase Cas3